MTGKRLNRLTCLAACVCAVLLALAFAQTAWATPPSAPTSLTVVGGTSAPNIATLNWGMSLDPETVGYHVYSSLSPSGPFALVGSVTGTTFFYTTGLGGFPYWFRVTAYNIGDEESDPISAGPAASTWAASPHVAPSTTSTTCGLCHAVHDASGDGGLIFRSEIGRDSVSDVCRACHDGLVPGAANVTTGTVDSFSLPSGHTVDASSTGSAAITGCASCHQVHGDASNRRMLPAREINGSTDTTMGPRFCESCHDEKDSWFGSGYPSTSAPVRNPDGYPVSGTWPDSAIYNGSTNAHNQIPESTQTAVASAPVKRQQGDCLYCHAAHRGPNAYDSLNATFTPSSPSTLASDQADGTFAALCFNCHGGATPSGFTTAPVDIKQFATAQNDTAGHRILSAGGTLPVGAPLPCYDCHNPHGSRRGNASLISDERGGSLETSSAAGVRHFCLTCHTTSDTGVGWDSASNSYQVVSDADEIEGLPRTGVTAKLRLPAFGAHEEANSTSCEDCHGSDYGAGQSNVHDPSELGGYNEASHTVTFGTQSMLFMSSTTSHQQDEISGAGDAQVQVDCSMCHSTQLATVHGMDCTTCHGSGTSQQVQAAVANWDGTCTACHTTYHSNVSEGHDAEYRQDGSGDDYGPYCGLCHGSIGGPDYSATPPTDGYPATSDWCGTCHQLNDTTPPTTTASGSGTGVVNGASVVGSASITFSAVDLRTAFNGDSSVVYASWDTKSMKATYYQLDAGKTKRVSGPLVVAPPVAGVESHTLRYWSTDWAGNTEPAHTASFTLAADTQAPVTSTDATSSYTGEATIHFSATDNGTAFGVKDTFFSLDGGDPVAGRVATIAPPASGSESHTIDFWSVDYAGNSETPNTWDFSVRSIPDTTPPSGTVAINGGDAWTKDPNVTLSLVATDNPSGSGVASMVVDPGAASYGATETFVTSKSISLPGADGTKYVHVRFIDRDGNISAPATATIGLDTVAPAGSMLLDGGASGTTTTTATIASSMADGGSGITSMSIDPGTGAYGDWIPYSANATITLPGADGDKTVRVRYRDAAGNITTKSAVITVDVTAPTGTVQIDSGATWATSPDVTLSLDASDGPNGSGVVSMTVDPGDGSFRTAVAYGTSYAITLAGSDGPKEVRVVFIDGAGNESAIETATIVLDTQGPNGTMVVNDGSAATSMTAATITSTMSDAVSGIASMSIDPGTGTYGGWVAYDPNPTISLPSGDGDKTVRVRYRDVAGNVTTRSAVITLDTVAPVTTSNVTPDGTYNGDQSFTLSPSDSGSGVARTEWRMDSTDGTWTAGTFVAVSAPSSGSQSHTLYWFSTDAAGNRETTKSVSFTITAPSPGGSAVFAATGADQTFVVPEGVTQLHVVLDGGAGGDNYNEPDQNGNYPVPAGLGGEVQMALPVTPGQTLTIRVGSSGNSSGATPSWPNGGDATGDGGAGGGSTAILSGTDVLVEAGGGGGASDYWASAHVAGQDPNVDPEGGALDGGYQGWLPGGNESGATGQSGGGGGWNGGFAGNGGGGGSSYIASGVGTLLPGTNGTDGVVSISW
jgi:hypothetical protein